jgi:hypothetical protein
MKSTGRDKPIKVIIHIYMETTQGISLYNDLYLKLANHHVSLFIFYGFMVFFLWVLPSGESFAPVGGGRWLGKG